MRAAVRDRYGGPEVVRVVDTVTPAPRAGEVLVRVHATTVNRTDCALRAASPFVWRLMIGLRRPRVEVLGTEFAGEVTAVGSGAASVSVGDRVFGFTGLRCGAHAEYVVLPAGAVFAMIPAHLSYQEAAACTEGAHYALSHLRQGRVGPSRTVLVYGATGAVGSAAVQVAKSLGAGVTAVCATAHVDVVRSLGADRVVDYTTEDFTRDAQVYDMVFDAAGKSSFLRCRRLLKPRGIYLSTGEAHLMANLFMLLLTTVLRRRRVVFPIPTYDAESLSYIKGLLETGEFRPLIDRTYPLDRIVEAYRYVDTGQKIGNVVITMVPQGA